MRQLNGWVYEKIYQRRIKCVKAEVKAKRKVIQGIFPFENF